MSTHNRYIYHCLKCGSIAIKEMWEECPHCCGAPMNQSAAETVEDATGIRSSDASHPPVEKPVIPVPPPDLSVWFD